jgi:hypothetical protein
VEIRHYTPDDDKAVTEILRESKLPDDLMKHREFESFVIDDGEVIGIMTMTEQHGLPVFHHGCIKKNRRSFKMARMLANFFKYYSLTRGFSRGIINARTDDGGRLKKITERLFKCKNPYARTKYSDWYLVSF